MVRLALNGTETHQNAGPSTSPSNTISPNAADVNMSSASSLIQHHHPTINNHNHHPSAHPAQTIQQQQHVPQPLPPPPHHHLHHENGVGLYVPYNEFYPADHGYFIPHEMCPAHAQMCLHSDFGKIQTKNNSRSISWRLEGLFCTVIWGYKICVCSSLKITGVFGHFLFLNFHVFE